MEAKNVRISCVYETRVVDSPKFTTIYEQKIANFCNYTIETKIFHWTTLLRRVTSEIIFTVLDNCSLRVVHGYHAPDYLIYLITYTNSYNSTMTVIV